MFYPYSHTFSETSQKINHHITSPNQTRLIVKFLSDNYRKVDASYWYKKYQLILLNHLQLYSFILVQSLDPPHSDVIQPGYYTQKQQESSINS